MRKTKNKITGRPRDMEWKDFNHNILQKYKQTKMAYIKKYKGRK